MLDKPVKVLHCDTNARVKIDLSYMCVIVLKGEVGVLHVRPKHG